MDSSSEEVPLSGDGQAQLIESMRARGSFEGARDRLTDTARVIADHIAGAVSGQTWAFDDDPHAAETVAAGLSCDAVAGDLARRPRAPAVVFGRTFTAEEFAIAAAIVREEAAQFGATGVSSMFGEPSKRDIAVEGNGYEFQLGQIDVATLTITGPCRLLQQVLDNPHGQR